MSLSIVSAPLSTLTGVIERITFHSEESGYTVARLNTGNIKQLTTIVGRFGIMSSSDGRDFHPHYLTSYVGLFLVIHLRFAIFANTLGYLFT